MLPVGRLAALYVALGTFTCLFLVGGPLRLCHLGSLPSVASGAWLCWLVHVCKTRVLGVAEGGVSANLTSHLLDRPCTLLCFSIVLRFRLKLRLLCICYFAIYIYLQFTCIADLIRWTTWYSLDRGIRSPSHVQSALQYLCIYIRTART